MTTELDHPQATVYDRPLPDMPPPPLPDVDIPNVDLTGPTFDLLKRADEAVQAEINLLRTYKSIIAPRLRYLLAEQQRLAIALRPYQRTVVQDTLD